MRKVILWALMGILILATPLSAIAFTDITDNPYEEAIEKLSNGGIITGYPDGTFKPDRSVSRAEFAAMITKYLGVSESILYSYKSSNFKDISGYGWALPYLAHCQKKGIILGDGKGNVMPGRTISYAEALAMVIRALDIENELDQSMKWPSNYIKLANSRSLTKGVDAGTKEVTRGVAAQLLFNGRGVTPAANLNVDTKVANIELYQPSGDELILCANNNIARNGRMDIDFRLLLEHEKLNQDIYKSLNIKVTTLNGAVTLTEKDFKVMLKKDESKTIASEILNIEDVASDNYDVNSYKIHVSDDNGVIKTATLNFFYDTTADEKFALSLVADNFKFYGSPTKDPIEYGKRQYYKKFSGRYKNIGVEIEVSNLDLEQDRVVPFTIEYKFPDGATVSGTYWRHIDNKITLTYSVYYGWATGRYQPGSHQVNVYVHDIHIGSDTFVILP